MCLLQLYSSYTLMSYSFRKGHQYDHFREKLKVKGKKMHCTFISVDESFPSFSFVFFSRRVVIKSVLTRGKTLLLLLHSFVVIFHRSSQLFFLSQLQKRIPHRRMKIIVEGLVADQQMASRPIGAMNLNRCHKASYYTFCFDLRVVSSRGNAADVVFVAKETLSFFSS